mgnify:CR=1 FL=1
MLRIGVACLIVGRVLDDALFQVNGGEHAAGVEVVHRPVAVADADMGIDDMGARLVEHCDHPQGVDGVGVHLVHGFVLLEHVLHHADALRL